MILKEDVELTTSLMASKASDASSLRMIKELYLQIWGAIGQIDGDLSRQPVNRFHRKLMILVENAKLHNFFHGVRDKRCVPAEKKAEWFKKKTVMCCVKKRTRKIMTKFNEHTEQIFLLSIL